ncbi:MAG: GNAT family N-acetyltransferase [Phycisphaerae bacterium]
MNAIIRPATRADLAALHELACATLVLDRFSPALLEEKLFAGPRPEQMTWETWVADVSGRPVGFMQSVVRRAAHKAWIGLFAVAPEVRRMSLATALFEHVRGTWPAEISTAEVLAIPANYFTPGLDPRYTEALCFLEALGFRRGRDCVNLRGDLPQRFDTIADQTRLQSLGIVVRRAAPSDAAALDAFFAAHFGDDWRFECSLAEARDPPAVHLAWQADQIIAFSAHSTQNREWGFFGPMGTAPAARGLGVGRLLLWHCLNDLYDAGHRTCVIPWVGPIAFYRRWAGCRVERVFWRYELDLSQRPTG